MPILILPPRNAPDAAIIRETALAAGWQVEQLASWRAPEALRGRWDALTISYPERRKEVSWTR
jgi:hypothetical protein